jgi:hypothetical protein
LQGLGFEALEACNFVFGIPSNREAVRLPIRAN